jgi:hypothetical protein
MELKVRTLLQQKAFTPHVENPQLTQYYIQCRVGATAQANQASAWGGTFYKLA